MLWRGEKLLAYAGNLNADHPAHSIVTVLTLLSQLFTLLLSKCARCSVADNHLFAYFYVLISLIVNLSTLCSSVTKSGFQCGVLSKCEVCSLRDQLCVMSYNCVGCSRWLGFCRKLKKLPCQAHSQKLWIQ